MVKEGSGVACNALKNLGVELLRQIRCEVERLIVSGPDTVTLGTLPLTRRVERVIQYSIEEARDLNHNYVGTEHILLGLLRDQEGVAAQVLMSLGITIQRAREEVVSLLDHGVGLDEQRGVARRPSIFRRLGRAAAQIARRLTNSRMR